MNGFHTLQQCHEFRAIGSPEYRDKHGASEGWSCCKTFNACNLGVRERVSAWIRSRDFCLQPSYMNNAKPIDRLLVFDSRAGVRRPVIRDVPTATSAQRGFRGFLFERHRTQDQENIDVSPVQTLIGLHLSDPINVEIRSDGPFRDRTVCPGDVLIFPAETSYSVRFKEQAEFIIMTLDQLLVDQACRAVGARDMRGRPVNWGFRDAFIKEALCGIDAAVAGSAKMDNLYAESLANSLAMHLARHGEKITSHMNGSDRGLSRHQLERTLDFIRSTPQREINLHRMAGAAGLSPFHFSRMFKLSTGLSPHQYVLRRRIELATELLQNRELEISDIAQNLGFADQSHFTMHFKRHHGMGPATYRRRAVA